MESMLPLLFVFSPMLVIGLLVLTSGAAPDGTAASAAKPASLYEKIGGEASVNAAVDIFYRKVLKDERIKHFFTGIDMAKQAAKQKAFLTMALGGPNKYTGEDMRKGHAHLVAKGLNNSHFDAVMENLAATLIELKVPGDLIAQAAAIAESTRKDVLAGEPSLYEKIGGEAAVNAAVDIFYRKVLQDGRIKQFFEGVDMAKQSAKQKAFLTMAFGGPNNYTGEDMRKGHAHLVAKGLNNSHFDAVMENLGATLTELKVPGELIAQAAAIAESTRKDVLAGATLYEKIGGEAAMNAAVDLFYRKVLQDDRIKHFFEGTDMVKQAAKQKAFLTMALGGPNNYTGEDMRKGHAHLVAKGLNDSHFDAVMENLGATLTELKVPGELIAQAAAIAESTRKDVLGK